MQSLDIISVNIWQILISLCNLGLIFLIVKRLLFAPIRKVIASRKSQIDEDYARAAEAAEKAQADQAQWEATLAGAQKRADEIIQTATTNATRRSDALLGLAREKADIIVRRAEEDARLEKKKAEEEIKHEITDVSVLLAEKVLDREIDDSDHRRLIDSFIETMGDGYDSDN